MTHKEMTAHIRNRIKAAGIKAKCKMSEYCGCKVITVAVPSFNARFTPDQIREFCMAAKANGLTFSQGLEIDPDQEAQLTEKMQWNFRMQ